MIALRGFLFTHIAIFAAVWATAPANGNTRTWSSVSDGNWSSAANWAENAVPTHNDSVTVPDATANRTLTVDVHGVTYHATVGANLPAGGVVHANAQMYWIIADYPMLDWSYVNYASWNEPAVLVPTTNQRWRGNPNDSFRTVNVSAGNYADFLGKYHPGNGINHGIDGGRTKREDDAPTPAASFNMADIQGDGPPNLYIAHSVSNTTQRPGWLTTDYTATGKQLYTVGGLTWDVYERSVTDNTAAAGDSTGWISDGGRLAALSITQASGSVTQTVALAHNLTSTTPPSFDVTAGKLVVDVGPYWFQVPAHIVIPSNVTVSVSGGVLGRQEGDATEVASAITIEAGGTLTGTGLIQPGRGDYVIEEGGLLEVGDGMLSLNFPFGNTFRWRGAIQGNGTSSIFNLAQSVLQGQLKGIESMAGNPNASVSGLAELRLGPNFANMTFGRFVAPERIDLTQTTVRIDRQTFLWEAQTAVDDVAAGAATAAFKLGGYAPNGNCTLKLVRTGGGPDDFLYIGTIQGLNASRLIELNDLALVTDMTESELDAFVTGNFIRNNDGTLGAPTVKSLNVHGDIFWYVAPADVTIPPPPPRGSLLILR